MGELLPSCQVGKKKKNGKRRGKDLSLKLPNGLTLGSGSRAVSGSSCCVFPPAFAWKAAQITTFNYFWIKFVTASF